MLHFCTMAPGNKDCELQKPAIDREMSQRTEVKSKK